MATIPITIAKYIRSIWMTEKTMAYFQVDQNENLVHWGGPVDHYGLIHLTLGQSIIDPLNFLEGMLPITEPLVLEFINLDDEHVAHIHLVPHQNDTWILLLDAHSEHEQQQQMQQQLNELKLLTYEKISLFKP